MTTCKRCGAARYPNEMSRITINGKEIFLCQGCERKMMPALRDRRSLGRLIHSTLPLGETVRINKERARRYAGSQFKEERP